MAVKLPFKNEKQVNRPKATRGFPNGRIPKEHLAPCGIRSFVMVQPAARAMNALMAAAKADGINISATGTYRSFDQQVDLFFRRFTRTNTGRRSKTFKGQRYWLQRRKAMAATPGTSNHGRGLAVDFSDTPTIVVSTKTLKWLAANGPKYGFFNTVKSEAWHRCYCLGDEVSPAVSGAEKEHGVKPAQAIDWEAIRAVDAELSAVHFPGPLERGDSGRGVTAVQWKLKATGHDLVVDGDFGRNTDAAVRAFQASNDLVVDGDVDAETWRALGLKGAGGGPAPIDVPPDPSVVQPHTAPAATIYVIQPNDGFLRIAKRTLWSKSMKAAEAIAEANDLALDSPIDPDQRLLIPDCRSTEVVSNDGWNSVAKRLGRTPDKVKTENAWQGADLHPGMIIYGGSAT